MVRTGEVVNARLRAPRMRAVARPRVDGLLDRALDHRLTLVVAPAGSGKTTALAQFAERHPGAVAWYRVDDTDGDPPRFLAHLEAACQDALGELHLGWHTIDDAAASLDGWTGGRAALVIDDLHTIRGSAAESALARLVDYLPDHVRCIIGARSMPSIDVSRLRLAGQLLELGTEELRFRTWEADHLFRELYDTTLGPEDLARLTRRVEGWAAGLQLYHLASRGRRPQEQRRLIDVAGRSRLGREYLARNVLDGLSLDVRSFLIDTCPLGMLTGPLCDALTGRSDSEGILNDLVHDHAFTLALDEEGTFRFHEVLRSHLEVLLVERDGHEATRDRFALAGRLHEADGNLAEALRCHARAQDWGAVTRVAEELGRTSPQGASWLDSLPPSMVAADPWLRLLEVKANLADGRIARAIAGLTSLTTETEQLAVVDEAHRLRRAMGPWLDPRGPAAGGAMGGLLRALRSDPLDLEPDPTMPTGLLEGGLAALAAGHAGRAEQRFSELLQHPGASAMEGAAAQLGLAVTALLVEGRADLVRFEAAESAAERAGFGWAARVARAVLNGSAHHDGPEQVCHACDEDGDQWGGALGRLLVGVAGLRRARSPRLLAEAGSRFRQLGAATLEALALAGQALALAAADDDTALEVARRADQQARAVASPGAEALAAQALALLTSDAGNHGRRAKELAGLCGLGLGFGLPEPSAGPTAGGVRIRALGHLEISAGGSPVDLSQLRPRARSLLRFLVLHADRPVHRERLIEAMWPGSDPAVGLRNLQVAVSAIRQVLPAADGLGVERDGDAYRLSVPDEVHSDLRELANLLASARTARDRDETVTAAMASVRLWRGELFAEEGPAEWVHDAREQLGAEVVAVATMGATAALELDRPSDAAVLADQALTIDRFADPLWHVLIEALERTGAVAAAERARQDYDAVRTELGVDEPVSASRRTRSR